MEAYYNAIELLYVTKPYGTNDSQNAITNRIQTTIRRQVFNDQKNNILIDIEIESELDNYEISLIDPVNESDIIFELISYNDIQYTTTSTETPASSDTTTTTTTTTITTMTYYFFSKRFRLILLCFVALCIITQKENSCFDDFFFIYNLNCAHCIFISITF